MELSKRVDGEVAVLTLSGKVMGGPDSMEKFKSVIKALIDDGITKAILDLSAVKRMNSSGLGILISGYTSFKNSGGELKLAAVNEMMEGLLVMTQLDRIFDVRPTVDDALNSF